MTNRLLIGFGMIVLAIGAYDAFTTSHPVMGILLTFGALALAIPVFTERK